METEGWLASPHEPIICPKAEPDQFVYILHVLYIKNILHNLSSFVARICGNPAYKSVYTFIKCDLILILTLDCAVAFFFGMF
jgi:hypothetical protein